jgi:acyl-CoA synthetase (AMP-forming)/AMP-acid ligase II
VLVANTEALLVNVDTQEPITELGPEHPGEMWIRGPQVITITVMTIIP